MLGIEAPAVEEAPAIKAGARNNQTDQGHLDAAHAAAHAMVNHTLAAGANCDACNSVDGPDDEGDNDGDEPAGKSVEIPPAPMLAVKAGDGVATMTGDDLAALRVSLSTIAVKAAREILGR